jgi:hypothetical protein
MKKIIFEKWKVINLISCVSIAFVVVLIYMYVKQGLCIDNCSIDLKKGMLNPLYSGGKILAMILGVLLLFPSHVFKKWLVFVLPIPLGVTYWLVQDISVYSGGVLYISRAQMAENGMIVLAIITALFAVGHLVYDWQKKK